MAKALGEETPSGSVGPAPTLSPVVNGRRQSPWRHILRFIGSVLMVSGILLIADAGVTLAWQEPVSAFFAERQQNQLKEELEDPPPHVEKRVREKRPLPGDAIGEIILPSLDKRYYVVEGTDTSNLRAGARLSESENHCLNRVRVRRRTAEPARNWQARRESNPQPPVLETGALPIELLA